MLNDALAQAVHLGLHAKTAHWNVKGPSFLQLHELFDNVYSEAVVWADDLAERAVQLGGIAESSLSTISGRTQLPELSSDLHRGPDLLVTPRRGWTHPREQQSVPGSASGRRLFYRYRQCARHQIFPCLTDYAAGRRLSPAADD